MTRAVVPLVLAAASCTFAAVNVQSVAIADGVYQFITAPDGYVPNGNSVVVINRNDVLVFDTFTRPSTAEAELAQIRKLTSKPARYVVNSHWHPDHWSGNEVYAREFPGVELIASEETRQLMLNIANAWPALYTANLRKDRAAMEEERRTGKRADGTAFSDEELRNDEADFRLEQDYVAESLTVHRTYPTLSVCVHHAPSGHYYFLST